MTAPEPVEVAAAELAAAELDEAEVRVLAISHFMWPDGSEESVSLRRYMTEYDRRGAVLERIADAHSKSYDSAGGTWGDCAECGWNWPCPTNVWATTSRDVLAPWNPTDDDEDADDV